MNSSSPCFVFPSFLIKCDRRTDLKIVTSVHSLCFCFRVSPMDPLVRPEFLLLQDRSLEDHTRLFLFVANTTSYQDNARCAFYDSSLNTACRALLSEVGPREDFAAFVEWTLARNGSPLTICPEDDLARSTPDPVPSPPSPHCSPLLEDALQCPLLENTHPSTHSCLLYRCRLAAPLLALSPPSMWCKLGRTAILQCRHGRSFPRLRLRGPDSASAHWPAGSTMAPSSLLSAVVHLPIGSAGLPRSSSSALVWRRPSCTSGLLRLRFVPLVPSGSFIPSAPPQSSVAPAPPQPSGFPSPPRSPAPSALPWSTRILPVALALRLSASGSSSTCSAAVGQPPGDGAHSSSMVPPSVGSTVGHCCGFGLGPAVHLLLRVPPVSYLASPSFVASLVSVCRPPPGCPSSSWASSLVPTRPSPLDGITVWGHNFWEGGRYVRIVDCLVCVLLPMCSLWPSFSLTWIIELIQVCLVFIPNCLCI